MYNYQVKEINEDLKKTKKAVIALGCSFTQGQGAINDEIFDNYKWETQDLGKPLRAVLSKKEKKQILKKYSTVLLDSEDSTSLDFVKMEYENAFVSVLCKKYFNGSYTPINLGLKGCGNRGTIKELYLNNEIDWHNAKEKIVKDFAKAWNKVMNLDRFDLA